MTNRIRILASLLVITAACGDDGNSNNDGGPGDGSNGTCTTAPLAISSVPGMVMGTVKGGGADLNSPEGSCTEEYGYYEPVGEDTVVAINGLTPGMRYGLLLSSEDDLSLYVTPSCPPATGMVAGCTTFTDEAIPLFSAAPEEITFTATASTHYVVVDTGLEGADIATGNFKLDVSPASCGPQTEMTDCTGTTPYCREFACRECVSGFDCAAGAPSCNDAYTCVAGPAQCTGDDTRDGGAGDDGPSVATMINAPTAVTATTITGNVCNTPAAEQDWYKVTLDRNVRLSLEFTGAANDLDLYLLDSEGSIVERAESNAGINELILTADITASGLYYVVVTQYAPMNTVAAVPYTLKLEIPECDPAQWPLPTCGNVASPVCTDAGRCGPGPATCTGDDAGDPNDDGPAGAQTLTSGVVVNASQCIVDNEFDWYKFTVTNGQQATVTVDWPTAGKDFDLQVTDAAGKVYGFTLNVKPEVVALTHLKQGTYYVRVQNYGTTDVLAADAYTIKVDIAATAQNCTVTKCAAEYKTQIFRGTCTTATNVCDFIPDSDTVAIGGSCDSDGDCAGTAVCSYATFQSNADKSKCGPMTCASNADCTAAGADFKCTTFSSGNTCAPACGANTDCGANNGMTFEPNHPWDYFTCTTATMTCGP